MSKFEGNTWFTYVLFSMIAIIAFFGNSLVIYVLVTRPSHLKHPYNIFIFNLAVTDVITSIMLIFSRFLYLPPVLGTEALGEIYCRTVWAGVVLFDLTFISVYTALALTFERWLAVVKPFVYRAVRPHHARKAVALIWIWGVLVNITTIFRAKFNKAHRKCTWVQLDAGNSELPWLDFFLQTAFPFFAITFLYGHILYSMKKLINISPIRRQSLKRVTHVALVTSSVMAATIFPSRVSLLMFKLGSHDARGVLHFLLMVVSFSNICFNPILYGICSTRLRREYADIWNSLFGQRRRRRLRNATHSVQPLDSATL